MQHFSGALMVLAGLALGGYSILPASQTTHDDVTLITQTPEPDRQPVIAAAKNTDSTAQTAPARIFSPRTPLNAPAPDTAGPATTTWTAVVTSERSAATNLTSPKPGDATARAHLASDLQRELKRVGCYAGEVNGAWTQSTRRAMALFMERVNATLPANEPDYILLTLVQNHTALACGTDCPVGEVQAENGRCLPTAVVAQANRRAQRREDRLAERRELEKRKSQQEQQLMAEQRIAARADKAGASDARAKPAPASTRSPAETVAVIKREPALAAKQRLAKVDTERLPWLDDNPTIADATPPLNPQREPQQAAAASSNAAPRSAPPPGMMSIGGPRELPAAQPITNDSRATARVLTIEPDRTDVDNLRASAETHAVPAEAQPKPRPQRQAALSRNTDAWTTVTSAEPVGGYTRPEIRRYPRAKIIRHIAPRNYYVAPRPRARAYAVHVGGKTRRGQPRPGTPRYNVMQTLGGIY